MNLANLSIKRPVFITCLVLMSIAVGVFSLFKLPIDLFPNVTFPVVTVTTIYRGAGPEEIETLISKPLEEELSSLGGIKRLKSVNREGVGIVIAEFSLETDVQYAEQQVRDRVTSARKKFPATGVDESIIKRIDPADQPVVLVALSADLSPAALFDLADKKVKNRFEQVPNVGQVTIIGGRKREVQVQLDRNKLKEKDLSVSAVAGRLGSAGQNVPVGKVDRGKEDTVVRTVAEFRSLSDIENTIVNFVGNDVAVRLKEVGKVVDGLEDEKNRAFYNGRQTVLLEIYRQSGSNTVQVVEQAMKVAQKLNTLLEKDPGAPKIEVVRDGAKPIRANLDDVKESIYIGILLTIVVVFFFLGSFRSTFITGMALPNSLIGAFILMWLAGFSINIMTLLALSLAVGLLIDDAIVVRENIFRHLEMGKNPIQAALEGTAEVTLAVVATTLTVIAVFGPIAFLSGVVGQFFRQFGLTVCFIMAVSLFDALTMAPMLSAYYAGHHGKKKSKNPFFVLSDAALSAFNSVYNRLEVFYEKRVLTYSLAHPITVLVGALIIFIASIGALAFVPKTFLPAQDNGEFQVVLERTPGTNLTEMTKTVHEVTAVVRANKEVAAAVEVVGTGGESHKAVVTVNLVPSKERRGVNTTAMKQRVREQMTQFKDARPQVNDFDAVGGGQQPFNLAFLGDDIKELEKVANAVLEKLRGNPALTDPDLSFRQGKPEFQIIPDDQKAQKVGVPTALLGQELRAQVDGVVPAKLRQKGEEYDIRVRLQPDQIDITRDFDLTYVPNLNNRLIRLPNVANRVETTGFSNIDRQNRGRVVTISAGIAPNGPGMGGAISDVKRLLGGEIPLPPGVRYEFIGQAENFTELITSMLQAAALGSLFIFLVLASLYESFITPLTIMLVLPLAAVGAFFALMVTHASLDIFSMIGCIMLMGIATKNSILLVDYTQQEIAKGKSRRDALLEAGRTRLRPILMTSFALVAGMLPVAIGLNEASKQRTSLGIAVIGGIISSTILTLVVVPAAFSYIDRFKIWSGNLLNRAVGIDGGKAGKKKLLEDAA
jgi:hydrophobic/amphiphilic exporter-1 (mainly G- bacteria), HAE1 family